MRLTAAESDLASIGAMKAERPTYDVELAPTSGSEAGPRASFELDLRGFRLVEALGRSGAPSRRR